MRARDVPTSPTPPNAALPLGVEFPEPDPPPVCLRAGALGLDPPRRPTSTSLGNGQIYDVRIRGPHDWDLASYVVPRVSLPTQGWHAPLVASYAPALGGAGFVWAIEVLDDDGNYNSRVTENLTLDQLLAFVDRYKNGTDTVVANAWRPLCISAYSISQEAKDENDEPTGEYSFSTRFTVSWIGDNWGQDATQNDVRNWDLLPGLTREELDIVIEAYGPAWRPLSVCGYAYAYESVFVDGLPKTEEVRYAVVMIMDGIDATQWKLQTELSFDALRAELDSEIALGRMPISISSWRSNMDGWPVGFVVDGPDANQRWSLLTVEDRSKDGSSPVEPYNFVWEVFPATQVPGEITALKKAYRPVCIAPFTSFGPDASITYEQDYASVEKMQLLVVSRRHPPRYWRVTWDTTFEPADLVPRTLALQADPSAIVDDPYDFIDTYVTGLMTSNLVNTMSWAVSVRNEDVGAVRAYTWAPEGFPTSYPNARFRGGSLAKDILATAIHKYAQDNPGVNLDGPFMPLYCANLFACMSPSYSGPQFTTFDSLMRHDGGWAQPSLAKQVDYETARKWSGQPYPLARAGFLNYVLQLPDGAPASNYWPPTVVAGAGQRRYSNFSYELLTDFLAKQLDDGDVDRYQREKILEPLGAFDTQWGFASRWQHLPGEVIGTPDRSSVSSGGTADYLDDAANGATVPTDPFSPPGATVGSLVRPPVLSSDDDAIDDDRWLEPSTTTEGYGGWVALGTVVQGSGATVTTALDALRLIRSLRNWEQPGFPAWGMQADDAFGGEEILSVTTVNAMLNRTGAVQWGQGIMGTQLSVLAQMRGWSAYDANASLPPPGSPMFVFAGGNIEGGSCLAMRSVAGSCFAVLASRNIPWTQQLAASAGGGVLGQVFSWLGG